MLWKRISLLTIALAILSGCGSDNGSGGGGSTGNTAYVTLPSTNSVGAYRVDSKGSFTRIFGSPFTAGSSPASVVVLPGTNFLYVANRGSNDISLMKSDSNTGALTEIFPRTPTGVTPLAMVKDSAHHLFVANNSSHTISVYSINSSSGVLTEIAGSPFTTVTNPAALTLSPSGTTLYVANVNLNSVSAFTVAGDGSLSPIAGTPFTVGLGPSAIAVDSSGKFVYVANSLDNTVSVLAVNATTGALSEVPGSPVASGTTPTAIALFNGFLYVANFGSSNVSAFSVDATSGLPTKLDNSPFTADSGPICMVVDSSRRQLFLCNQGAKSISHLGVKEAGGLATSAQSTTVGFPPTSLAFAP